MASVITIAAATRGARAVPTLVRVLAGAVLVLCLVVVVLGAYVRLSNAGLGCPDWPGCYDCASSWRGGPPASCSWHSGRS